MTSSHPPTTHTHTHTVENRCSCLFWSTVNTHLFILHRKHAQNRHCPCVKFPKCIPKCKPKEIWACPSTHYRGGILFLENGGVGKDNTKAAVAAVVMWRGGDAAEGEGGVSPRWSKLKEIQRRRNSLRRGGRVGGRDDEGLSSGSPLPTVSAPLRLVILRVQAAAAVASPLFFPLDRLSSPRLC